MGRGGGEWSVGRVDWIGWRGGVEWSRVHWNGMERNGMEWNGMEWNGMEWSGWNGMDGWSEWVSGWRERT